MSHVLDVLLHVDRHLLDFVHTYGAWTYGLLFAIIFAETGLVVTAILPGDSLLFATGAICATGALDAPRAIALLIVAAFAGNAVNYAMGRFAGPRIFAATDRTTWIHRLLNREYLDQAHAFFVRYGGKAIVLGRFVPIVRTFVPFVAGAASMPPGSFVFYNAVGAAAWVGLCTSAGLLFGNVPVIKAHFSLATLGIVAVSLLPMAIGVWRHRRT